MTLRRFTKTGQFKGFMRSGALWKSNTAIMALSSVMGQGFVLVSGVVVARSFDPSDRGLLAIFSAVAVAVSSSLLLGLPSALVYYSAVDRAAPWLKSSWFRGLVAAMVASAALIAIAVLFQLVDISTYGAPAWQVGLLLALSCCGIVLQSIVFALMQGRDSFLSVAMARLLPSIVYAGTVLALFLLGRRILIEYAAAWVLSNLLVIAIYLRRPLLQSSIRGTLPLGSVTPVRNAREVMGYGLRSHVGTLSPLDNLRVDQLIASVWMSPVALGLYVVAQSFAAAPKILANNLGYAVHADSSRDSNASATVRRSRLRGVLMLCSGLFVACAVIAGLMPFLMPLLFGAAYVESVPASQLLVLAAAFAACRRLIGEYAKGLGSPMLLSIAEFVVVPVLVLWMLVIPDATGLVGFSTCMLCAQLTVTAGSAVAFARLRHG